MKSQPSIAYRKACKVVFQSSKNKEIALPFEFIFAFIQYFVGAILSIKCYQEWGACKKDRNGGGGRGGDNLIEGCL